MNPYDRLTYRPNPSRIAAYPPRPTSVPGSPEATGLVWDEYRGRWEYPQQTGRKPGENMIVDPIDRPDWVKYIPDTSMGRQVRENANKWMQEKKWDAQLGWPNTGESVSTKLNELEDQKRRLELALITAGDNHQLAQQLAEQIRLLDQLISYAQQLHDKFAPKIPRTPLEGASSGGGGPGGGAAKVQQDAWQRRISDVYQKQYAQHGFRPPAIEPFNTRQGYETAIDYYERLKKEQGANNI